MSGFEIAGVVFGVLPILIEVVKSYQHVAKSFRTFRHYSKEVRNVQVQFMCHHGIFLNECRLLLRLIEDERGTKEMLDDETDQRWTSKSLNDKLNEVLKDNFHLCRSIIEASKEIVDGLSGELQKFDVLVERKDQGESVKSAIRRLRNAVRITFDKSKYEKSLAGLRDRTSDLTQLRAHIGASKSRRKLYARLEAHSPRESGISRLLLRSSTKLCLTRGAAENEARETTMPRFASMPKSRQEYDLILRFLAKKHPKKQETRAYCESRPIQHLLTIFRALVEPPIWLYVQSISIDTTSCCKEQLESAKGLHGAFRKVEGSTVASGSKNKASSSPVQALPSKKKRMKKVHFTDATPESETVVYAGLSTKEVSVAISQAVAKQTSFDINLCQTKNICHYLKQNVQLCGTSLTKHCVGYLESPQMYRHIFYLQNKELSSRTRSKVEKPTQTSVFSILDLMGHDVDDALTVVDQLKLAHKTALAILQFNSTPWLLDRWRLKDFGYFSSEATFDEEALKTLHLSSKISSATDDAIVTMADVSDVSDAYSEEDIYGINNTTLFFLGVALLELAHWKSLESLRVQQDLHLILTARRLASRPTSLGPKYQAIAQKCLQCNFGFGTNLNKRELQAAVYGDVVCQLEKMIDVMSI